MNIGAFLAVPAEGARGVSGAGFCCPHANSIGAAKQIAAQEKSKMRSQEENRVKEVTFIMQGECPIESFFNYLTIPSTNGKCSVQKCL
jgi:hypothetical protein